MNIVMIIPTGIGAEVGGHAGDATPAARMLGVLCDKLILHPNVVNASDLNEMPENALYVEGSMLDRFLEGKICLQEVRSNKVLVATNPPLCDAVVNSVSAARATLGLDASVVVLETPLTMKGWIKDNHATGEVHGWEELVEQVKHMDFDALAITTSIDVDRETQLHYLKHGGINPWGGVEAKASRLIATALDKPSAHSPMCTEEMMEDKEVYFFMSIVDPRIAPEIVSISYLHCVLKGLHKAPRVSPGRGLSVDEVDVLVSPYRCFGRPHKACREKGIPIIAVLENKTAIDDVIVGDCILVENYWEAAGVIVCMKAGVDRFSVRRPLAYTEVVIKEKKVKEEGDKSADNDILEKAEKEADYAKTAT